MPAFPLKGSAGIISVRAVRPRGPEACHLRYAFILVGNTVAVSRIMPAMSDRTQRPIVLVCLLAGLAMIGPFSIDTMFPGFPDMARDFAASDLALQQTVSVYLLAYACMSLLHGPLSDAWGRRPIIMAGMLGYALASVGAACADSLDSLLWWRAMQGVFAGAGIVVGRAVVRDLFEGPAAQKLMSQVMMIFGIAPAIAPVVGAQLVGVAGWRGIFWSLSVFAVLLVLATWLLLAEPLPAEQRSRLSPGRLFKTYTTIFTDRGFWPLVISGTLNFSALFLYIVSAPRVVLDLMQLSRQGFPWLFVPVIGGIMAGSWLSSRLAGRRSAAATVAIGYGLMLVANVANLTVAFSVTLPAPPWVAMPLVLQGMGVGLAFPTLTLLLLDRFPRHRGTASSLQAFVSLLFNAALAGLLAPLLYADLPTLAMGAATIALLAWLAWRWYMHVDHASVARHEAAGSAEVAIESGPIEPA